MLIYTKYLPVSTYLLSSIWMINKDETTCSQVMQLLNCNPASISNDAQMDIRKRVSSNGVGDTNIILITTSPNVSEIA